jgi:hypothetical protein
MLVLVDADESYRREIVAQLNLQESPPLLERCTQAQATVNASLGTRQRGWTRGLVSGTEPSQTLANLALHDAAWQNATIMRFDRHGKLVSRRQRVPARDPS